jgi:hypothetical protein
VLAGHSLLYRELNRYTIGCLIYYVSEVVLLSSSDDLSPLYSHSFYFNVGICRRIEPGTLEQLASTLNTRQPPQIA